MRGLFTHPIGQRPIRVALLAAAALAITVAPALANPVPTTPDPARDCDPAYGSGLLTRYVTTFHTPADSTDWWVRVDFTLEDPETGSANCEMTLATYELASAEFTYPQSLFDSDSGSFGAGTHSLTADLPLEEEFPGCHGQYDFVFGPAIEELTFENRYDHRQIRARIVGSAECPAVAVAVPTPTPTPSEGTQGGTPPATPVVSSPTSPPREDVAGGTPSSTPAGGALPDTSLSVTGTGTVVLAGFLGLVMLGSISALAVVNVRARHTRR